MGSIDFIGLTHGIIEMEKPKIPLPNNAIRITEYADDISLFNCILSVVPIILIIILFLIIKIKKYNIKKDFEEYIHRYLEKYKSKKRWQILIHIELKNTIISLCFLCLNIILHEFIHTVCEYFSHI